MIVIEKMRGEATDDIDRLVRLRHRWRRKRPHNPYCFQWKGAPKTNRHWRAPQPLLLPVERAPKTNYLPINGDGRILVDIGGPAEKTGYVWVNALWDHSNDKLARC